MPEFELTPEQEAIAFTSLNAADIAAESGDKGMIIAQIGVCRDEKVRCIFNFIGGKTAKKLLKIIKDV